MREKPLLLMFKGMRLASLAVIIMLLLAACSSNNNSSNNGVPATGSTATPTTSSSATTPVATTAATVSATVTSGAMYSSTGTPAATGAATTSATTAATGGTPAATTATTPGAMTQAMVTPATTITLTVKNDAKLGNYLADEKGMTLYQYARDTAGKSTCEGACLQNWPPLLVVPGGKVTITGGGDQTLVGTITRSDGTTQVTYRNLPLYYFIKDKAAGDINGQGVGSVWSVVKP